MVVLLPAHRADERRFLREVETRVEVLCRIKRGAPFSDEAAQMRRTIAHNVLDVSNFSAGVGMPIALGQVPKIFVEEIFPPEMEGTADAFIDNYGIHFKKGTYRQAGTHAHELFHVKQHENPNLGYERTPEVIYLEGGANFFRYAFTASKSSLDIIDQPRLVMMMLAPAQSHHSLVEAVAEFVGMRRSEKMEVMKSMLGLGKTLRIGQAYRAGDSFASVAFALNGYDVARTARFFRELTCGEAVRGLVEVTCPQDVLDISRELRMY